MEKLNRLNYKTVKKALMEYLSKTTYVSEIDFDILKKAYFDLRLQDDDTKEIKKNNEFLYHWTPLYNIDGIVEKGLLPNGSNGIFSNSPRMYFIVGNEDISYVEELGKDLCLTNNNPKNDGQYALLKICLEGLEDVSFYYASNTVSLIYTEQKIPNSNIQYVKTYNFYKN